jgi:hypothetical protein
MNTSFTPIDSSTMHTVADEYSSDEQTRRLMSEFSIGRAGRYYTWRGYRYECLADAVNYAQLVRTRPAAMGDSLLADEPVENSERAQALTPADREHMFALGIGFEKGQYVFAGYRYDLFVDAEIYARKLQGIAPRDG